MEEEIHTFDNSVKVYKDQLLPIQVERYSKINLHEPEEEEYFLGTLETLSKYDEPIFVDIGPAIGYYSILAKIKIPKIKIIVFEPLDEHRKYLTINWKLNELPLNDLTIYKEAIFSKKTTLLFYKHHYGSGVEHGSLNWKQKIQNYLGFNTKTHSVVHTMKLDDLVKKIGEIHFLKIDVQGAEVNVLKGAINSLKLKKIKSLILGTHGGAIHDQCLKIFNDNGYRIIHDDKTPKDQPDGIILATCN